MCGIFGVFEPTRTGWPSEDILASSASLLSHRGPDDCGLFVNEGIGLAHTRLSLVDINPRSNQPLWDDSGRYCIVYNGEIYNYRTLRAELSNAGCQFRTESDTEVLLQGLIRYGIDFLPRLEGMFAFAFFDQADKTMLLSRDRFGIKPLYYYHQDSRLLFSSEIVAIGPWIKLRPDHFSISSYLLGFGGPTQPSTFFENIKMLPAGHFMKVDRNGNQENGVFFNIDDFWHPDLHEELSVAKDETLIDRLDNLLQKSVDKHMIADVPVGALCSGGVDSSLLVAIAKTLRPDIELFHANVVGPHSEYDAADTLAKHLGLNLNTVEINDDDFINKIPDVTYHYGQPFLYHPNSIPFYMVSELVSKHGVKAILTGEGADECFLGYAYLPLEDRLSYIRSLLIKLNRIARLTPYVGRILWPYEQPDIDTIRDLHNAFETNGIEHQKNANLPGSRDKSVQKTLRLMGYHLRTLLNRNDTMGMAHSIEARFPFLDHEFARFAINLPYRHKIRPSWSAKNELRHPFMHTKWILRQVASRYLPRDLSGRRKRGFPTNAIERMDIRPDYFQDSYVSDLFELSRSSTQMMTKRSSRQLLTRLLFLDIWGSVFFWNKDRDHVASKLSAHSSIKP